jgi:hypothetical protein
MPAIPATQEAEIRGFQFEVSPGKVSMKRPYLKNTLKTKGLGHVNSSSISSTATEYNNQIH